MSRCKLGVLLDATTVGHLTEWSALNQAVQDRENWSARQLSKAIRKVDEGVASDISIGATTIKEHRNRTCSCYDD